MKVHVSFDYSEDIYYLQTLKSWGKEESITFEINEQDLDKQKDLSHGQIKGALLHQIEKSDIMLVVVGSTTNFNHPRGYQIGEKNWQVYEIEKAHQLGKRIVALKTDASYSAPSKLSYYATEWVNEFDKATVIKALNHK